MGLVTLSSVPWIQQTADQKMTTIYYINVQNCQIIKNDKNMHLLEIYTEEGEQRTFYIRDLSTCRFCHLLRGTRTRSLQAQKDDCTNISLILQETWVK